MTSALFDALRHIEETKARYEAWKKKG
jgi:hypothetical protein